MSDRITVVQPGPLSIIALGIAERLKLVFPVQRFTHDYVPARVSPEVWQRLLRKPPFIGIGFGALNGRSGSATEWSGTSSWMVYLATVNQTGPRERYLGDKMAPGLLDLMVVATAALHGHNVPNGGGIEVEKAENVFVEGYEDDNLAIAAVELVVRTSLPLNACISNVDVESLTTQDIQWMFDGSGITTVRDEVTGAS